MTHSIPILVLGIAGLLATADAGAAPPGAIPIHCVDAAGVGAESIVSCHR